MKILLVGGTGQIGHALLQALAVTEHEVTVLVRRLPALKQPLGVHVLQSAEFTEEAFLRALEGMDAAIYGVGLPEQFAFDPALFERVNHDILRTFLRALENTPVRRLVYLSTYEVFEAHEGVVREAHQVRPPEGMTPYFQAMIRAYRHVLTQGDRMGLTLTTIHPAAVYGGRDTGDGFTHFLENLINWRVLQLPAVVKGRFPVVHARSLAEAIISAFDYTGPFIVSDGMTSMRDMARHLRRQRRSYVPLAIPRLLAYLSASLFEWGARLTGRRPILAQVQVDFITRGDEPLAERAQDVLNWQPVPLDEGIRRYLAERQELLAQ